MIIENINFKLLTNDEFATLTQRMLGHTTEANSETLVLTQVNDVISSQFQKLQESMAKNHRSLFTDILSQKDKIRDNAFLRFRYYTKSATYHSDEEVAEAALNLLQLIRDVGFSLQIGGNKTQTSKMNLLKEKLTTTPASEWVTKIGADDIVAEIWTAQDDFEATNKEKVDDESVANIPAATEVRHQLETQIRSALDMIASNYRFLGSDELKILIDHLNEEIVASMSVARARNTRNKNSEEDEQ